MGRGGGGEKRKGVFLPKLVEREKKAWGGL